MTLYLPPCNMKVNPRAARVEQSPPKPEQKSTCAGLDEMGRPSELEEGRAPRLHAVT